LASPRRVADDVSMATLDELWPVFALQIRSGPITLSAIRDTDLPELVALVEAGIHDPAEMPFLFPWTDAPAEELAANCLRHWWSNRVDFAPDHWKLDLVVRHEGTVVGLQGLRTRDFPVTRTGETGSWLGRAYQGQGIGTTMRQAICAFAFDYLDAAELTSGAFLDNPASMAVSRKCGYRPNGTVRVQRRPGELAINQHLVIGPGDLRRPPWPIEVDGADGVRRLMGLTS
jgi:RimJ/RimL family protein N-acetyltransferase